ncbi:MAG: TolC family protein [Bacteroidales bacterium]|nr:TolC family protein [Bacteroidales bacterium]
MKPIINNKTPFLLLLLVLATSGLQAQITLQQAVQKGLKNSRKIKSSLYEYEAAQWKLKAEKSKVQVPSLSFGAGVTRNLIIPATPVPLSAFTGQGNANDVEYLKFGTNWQSSLGLTLSYDLFNPANKQTIDQQNEQTGMASIDYAKTQSDVRFNIMKAYAQVVLAKAQLNYAIADTLSGDRDYKTTFNLYQKGRQDEQTLNNMNMALSQAQNRYYNANMVYLQARMELAYQLGYQAVDSMPEVVNNLNDFLPVFNQIAEANYAPDQTFDYQKMEQQLNFDKKNVQHLKQMFLPVISVKAAYGTDYYKNDAQFFNSDSWNGNSYIGLNLQLPILKNIINHRNIQVAKLQRDQTQNDMQDYLIRVKSDMNKAWVEINAYSQMMQKNKQQMDWAEKNYHLAQDLYQTGRQTATDLMKSKLNFESSKASYLQAYYNYILARINLMQMAAK